MRRSSLITLVVLALFGVLLLLNTLEAQKATCTVCVQFGERRNCATASHESEVEARRSAQSTACGPIASGIEQSLACDRMAPASVECRNH